MKYAGLSDNDKEKYVREVLVRGSFFRHEQLWPLAESFDYGIIRTANKS